MSIYQKICPECAAANPLDAISCHCGCGFDPAGNDSTDYAEQQDRLYRDYLAARITQAETELAVARERANADPGNTHNASSALLAEQALHALQAELRQLDLKLPAATPNRPRTTSSQPVKPTPPRTAVLARNAPLAPKEAPKIASKVHVPPKVHAPRAQPPVLRKAPAAPVAARSKPKPSPIARSRAPIMRSPMNGVKAAIGLARKLVGTSRNRAPVRASTNPAPVAPVARVAPATPIAPIVRVASVTPPAPAAPINGKHHQPKPNVSSQPAEGFRRIQAQKAAEVIARSNRPASTPAAPVAIKPAPQQASADIPPLLLGAQNSTQECPNCTATVAANSTRCSCGYALSRPGEEVPAITLDATALAILTEGISFTSSNRRR